MVLLAKDTPQYLIEMFENVDYSKITKGQYSEWRAMIEDDLGKHVSVRSDVPELMSFDFSMRQSFADVLNRYDFRTLSALKRSLAMPVAKIWANKNLPLYKKF